MSELSQQQKREAIAKALNMQRPDCTEFFGDLNSCHAAELALSDEQHHVFRLTLADLTSPNPTDWNACSRAYISATSEERAEALFQAISITQAKTP